jgi:hypothetical protein
LAKHSGRWLTVFDRKEGSCVITSVGEVTKKNAASK